MARVAGWRASARGLGVCLVVAGAAGCGGAASGHAALAPLIEDGQSAGVAVAARPQRMSSDRVVVEMASLSASGYLAVFEDVDGTPGRLLGRSELLAAGDHSDVPVALKASPPGDAVFVVVHAEDNGNESFDFPDGDRPFDGSTGVVLIRIPLEGTGLEGAVSGEAS